jgi:hypothetical protein
MAATPIIVVSLSVAPEQHAAFTEFYHHHFLPDMLKEVPEIQAIRRYEELGSGGGGGTLRLYNKQTITIYELKPDTNLERVDDFFALPALKDSAETFGHWKSKSLRNFSRIIYKQTWESDRNISAVPFSDRSFFLFALEMKKDMDEPFQAWYENEYLPLQIADIPGWTAVRRYQSVNREQVRHLTFFEAADEEALNRCLKDLRAAHRINQNYEWQKRVEDGANWQETISFRAIYRRPG